MHSWEMAAQRANSVLIALLVPPGGVSIDWALAFAQLQKPPLHDIMRLTGLPWGEARTQAAYQMLNGGYQYLFFLDIDVITPPDTIMRLLGHRLPIVSGLYHQRFPSWTGIDAAYLPCMFNESADQQGNPIRTPITDFQYGSMVEAAYVPGGCLLIHRSVFEAMLAAGIQCPFKWTLTADNPQRGRSEDFEFCWLARQLGFKCIVDTGIQATHETQGKITVKGLEVKL